MHKMQVILLGFGLLLMLAIIGCGDDDCPACPDLVTPLGYTQCALILSPGANIVPGLEVFSYGAVAPSLDSVKVGDSLVDRLSWELAIRWPYADAHWLIGFHEDGDTGTFMYEHGDVATIDVWGEGRSSACQVKILNPDSAIANITDPAYLVDTIAPGGSDTVFWNTVEHVDYYAVMIAWLVQLGGDINYTFDYHYATDTSFIITGAMQPPDSVLEFNMHVTPFNGPDPRTGRSNWSGTLLDGVVCSYGYQNSTTIVIRSPIGPPPKALPKPAAGYPERNSEEIVASVYKKYGK
jgi:hypothetical protein